ncbi:HYR-like domain-containing protein, partial [Winogradskyella vincentii]
MDTTDPVLAGIPSDTTVECDSIPAAASPTASDNCDANVDIAFNETTTPGSCPDSYTITRTWTATDDCGNTDVQSQTITVEDTTAPGFNESLPADTTVTFSTIPVAPTLT